MSPRSLRVEIKTPGQSTTAVTLDEAQSALVGRSPDPDSVGVGAGAGGTVNGEAAAQLVTLASPNVSANHLGIHHHGDEVTLVELGSRNGTWLRLPPHAELRFAVPSGALALQVAPAFDAEDGADGPEDAHWAGPEDYATSVERRIAEWLERRELPGRTSLVAGSAQRSNRVGRMPLATGQDLMVELLRTADTGWLQSLALIERYVARHNVLFETEQTMREDGLIVTSPAMRRAVAKVIDAAASGARVVLITGPSGSGKEGLARCFHRHTERPGPFVARNCAMFSKELVRSELFGAERGAFTGSVQRIVGAVEIANEGTLFLDELGELPKDVQPMLLRFLDHGDYERMGSGQSQRADVRIVCATNRDLRMASLADEFRTDLWFRLSVHVVDVPPLRDRGEDITTYLKSRPRGSGSLHEALSADALALLADHDWPGNFRELISFAERLAIAVPRGPIGVDAARAALAEGALLPLKHPPSSPGGPAAAGAGSPAAALHADRAAAQFIADHGAPPNTWDEVKDFVENYWKPIIFAELSGSSQLKALDAVDLRGAADRLGSDRGTAAKQLRRFFDRFARSDG